MTEIFLKKLRDVHAGLLNLRNRPSMRKLSMHHNVQFTRGVLVVWVLAVHALAWAEANGPILPCGDGTYPPYAGVGKPVHVHVWLQGDLPQPWVPTACSSWKPIEFTVLATGTGRFRFGGTVEHLLTKIGAISDLTTIQYWSVTSGSWKDLIPEAFALSTEDQASRRENFSPEDLRVGRALFFWQAESTSVGTGVYRLRVLVREEHRLMVEVVNTDPLTLAFLTLFEPGESQVLYFFEKESSGIWRYYSLFRTSGQPIPLVSLQKNSYINRTVAMFRYFSGIPTDQEPPAAP